MRSLALILSVLLLVALFHIHNTRFQSDRYSLLVRNAAETLVLKTPTGNKTMHIKDVPAVLKTAAKGINVNPYQIEFYGYAGAALQEFGQYQEALKLYDKVLKYYPYHLNVLINSTLCLKALGRIGELQKTLQRIKAIRPSFVKRMT